MNSAVTVDIAHHSSLPKRPLTGKVLLKRIEELKGLDIPFREKAKLCGYYRVVNGKIQAKVNECFRAILVAQGLESEDINKTRRPTAYDADYAVCVHKNGNIVIGKAYTQRMGIQPGQRFQIKPGHKRISLICVDEPANGNSSHKNGRCATLVPNGKSD